MIKIPILSYHSHAIAGNSYETNDHIALYEDLRTIHALGFQVVPLQWIVDWVLGQRDDWALHRSVAISFDDGANADYYDFEHPEYGSQRSFFNILRDFLDERGESVQPHLQATSFVIGSPQVREELDIRCLREVGLTGMSDEWWNDAQQSGLLSIQNHSWDHNHPAASGVCQKNQQKGSFTLIDSFPECQGEVRQAASYIRQKIAPAKPVFFAYPWGESSAYLRDWYFPFFASQHEMIAAFGGSGGYVTRASSRWDIPRFVHGAPEGIGWKTPSQFKALLHEALVVEGDNIKIVKVDDAPVFVSHLFRQAFDQPAPVEPVHYVAFAQLSSTTFEVAGYYHADYRDDYILLGGLCVEPRYRNRGIGERLAAAVFDDIGDKKAFFSITGNPVTERMVLSMGYEKTSQQYLVVKWMKRLSQEDRERFTAEVAALGPF
jgi:ribosomal protein S18 acetylase RimI-like enzyme